MAAKEWTRNVINVHGIEKRTGAWDLGVSSDIGLTPQPAAGGRRPTTAQPIDAGVGATPPPSPS